MVRPGELVVVQRGMKFKVELPDGPVRGCTFHLRHDTLCDVMNSMSSPQISRKSLVLSSSCPSSDLWALTDLRTRAILSLQLRALTLTSLLGKVCCDFPECLCTLSDLSTSYTVIHKYVRTFEVSGRRVVNIAQTRRAAIFLQARSHSVRRRCVARKVSEFSLFLTCTQVSTATYHTNMHWRSS